MTLGWVEWYQIGVGFLVIWWSVEVWISIRLSGARIATKMREQSESRSESTMG
jgi:hypothetical protein